MRDVRRSRKSAKASEHSYISIMVNANGQRFVDEGADFRNFTYAKYGHVVQQQPGMFAWQVFDKKVEHLLRDEYRIKQVTKVVANSLEELAGKLEGVSGEGFLKTVAEYNKAVKTEVPFSPVVKDGRGTTGLAVPKSNWANTIDTRLSSVCGHMGVPFTSGDQISTHGNAERRGAIKVLCRRRKEGDSFTNYPSAEGLCRVQCRTPAGTSAGSWREEQ